jgi:hypothetical protein
VTLDSTTIDCRRAETAAGVRTRRTGSAENPRPPHPKQGARSGFGAMDIGPGMKGPRLSGCLGNALATMPLTQH